MLKIATILYFLIISLSVFAGNDLEVTVKGKVIDKNARESIAGVQIKTTDGKVIGYTDLDGYFEVKINYNLVKELNFSALSYEALIMPSNALSSTLTPVELIEKQ
jgi:hypothetical protein